MIKYQKIFLKDKAVEQSINKELIRQQDNIELIASENYASEDVLKDGRDGMTNMVSPKTDPTCLSTRDTAITLFH